MQKTSFKNEIGNKIDIKIKNVKDTGKNNRSDKKFRFDAVNIQIIGPTSVSENTITYEEAKKLNRLLNEFLKNNKMKTLKEMK